MKQNQAVYIFLAKFYIIYNYIPHYRTAQVS